MKFTVELDDFWHDTDGDLSKELSKYVIEQVKYQIWDKIEKKVQLEITEKTIKKIDEKIFSELDSFVEKNLNLDKFVVKKGYNNEETPLLEYIQNRINDNSSNYIKAVEQTAENHIKVLRAKYDLLFASQIIGNMQEQGLLKEGVYDALLKTK